MKKKELKDLIKKLTTDIINNTEEKSTPEKEIPLTTKYSRFDLLVQFPEMIPVLTDLMTNDFELFLKDIFWVAPKPSTFKFMLINGQHFFLIYDERSWVAQVEGKKYYLLELRESQLASEAISRILRYGKIEDSISSIPAEKSKSKSKSNSSTKSEPEGEEISMEEPPVEEPTPDEETA